MRYDPRALRDVERRDDLDALLAAGLRALEQGAFAEVVGLIERLLIRAHPQGQGAVTLPCARLVELDREGASSASSRVFELDSDACTLGRSPQVEVWIRDGSVARKHARIERHPEGFLLTDLLSTNGTWLNGRRVKWAVLNSGDRVDAARFGFRFEQWGGDPAWLWRGGEEPSGFNAAQLARVAGNLARALVPYRLQAPHPFPLYVRAVQLWVRGHVEGWLWSVLESPQREHLPALASCILNQGVFGLSYRSLPPELRRLGYVQPDPSALAGRYVLGAVCPELPWIPRAP